MHGQVLYLILLTDFSSPQIYEEGYSSCHPSQLSREPMIDSLRNSSDALNPKPSSDGLDMFHTTRFQRQAKKFLPLLHSWATLEESRGRLTQSRGLLKEALRLDPGHMPSWMSLGRLIWSLGGADEGRKVWGLACKVAGPSAPLLHQWAQKELRAGGNIQLHRSIQDQRDQQEATATMSSQPNSGSDHPDPMRISSLEKSSSSAMPAAAHDESKANKKDEYQLEEGDQVVGFSSASSRPPRWPLNLTKPWEASTWSTAPTATASRSRSRALLTLAIEIDPKHGPSIQALAALEDRTGQAQRSDALYLSHLSNTTSTSALSSPQVMHSRAIQLLKRGERDEAMDLLSQLAALHPDNAHLCHTMGLLAQQVRLT